MTYYKTTDLTHDELQERIQTADTQENIIQAFFNNHPHGKFTASDLEHLLKSENRIGPGTPITSIRRALTNLKKDGRINKLDEFKKGPYGMNEHFYQLSTGWGKTTGAGYAEIQPSVPTLF